MKRMMASALLLALATLASAPAGASHGTTMSQTYVGPDLAFMSDDRCTDATNSTAGIACFDIPDEAGLTTIDIEIADTSDLPTPGYIEVFDPAGNQISGGKMCGEPGKTTRFYVQEQQVVASVVVRVEFVSDLDCGPTIADFFYPRPGGTIFATFA